MSNQIEYFKTLVDNAEDTNLKWILQEQLQKEQRRIAKKRIADRLAREEAAKAEQTTTPTVLEDKPKRGRKPKQDE